MNSLKTIILIVLAALFTVDVYAHLPKDREGGKTSPGSTTASLRDCETPQFEKDLSVNNVRARLKVSGDLWWADGDAKYIIPNVEPGSGIPEVSSIFAGAVWLGGIDGSNILRLACQQYGSPNGNSDFFAGPLFIDNAGATDDISCQRWDKIFNCTGDEITAQKAKAQQKILDPNFSIDIGSVPQSLKGWPSRGNPYFEEIHGFALPNQELAEFFDVNNDEVYDPADGDFPIIGIRGADPNSINETTFGDDMNWFVYNDNGGQHTESGGAPIRMEVQCLAFGFKTTDQINDMSFYRYKLLNRANDFIDSTFFAMWVDADLGCYTDDYIGCDIERSLAYAYNADAFDDIPCDQGVPAYGSEIPIIGFDYFRGPLGPKVYGPGGELSDPAIGQLPDTLIELGMTSFTYVINGASNPGQSDPDLAVEYYRYLTGSWRDGTPFTVGGDAYGGTEPLDYAFPGNPNDPNSWSMCSEGLPIEDRRTIQATGPFRLDPGAKNELIIGVVWVPDQSYPCPDITELQVADDISQALFDVNFDLIDGPDAPDLDIIELDRELVLVLSNSPTSNNFNEEYVEYDPTIPNSFDDTTYNFEGYIIYQLADPSVGIQDLDDPDKAKVIKQMDVKNGVSTIYNWAALEGADLPTADYSVPVLEVEGENLGISHTLSVKEDFFATEDRSLVNHKKYYYLAVSYAFNNYQEFDPTDNSGQFRLYLQGRNNVKTYVGIPRINTPEYGGTVLNANYGDIPRITRYDGVGNGGNFLNIDDATAEKILSENSVDVIQYELGGGPIKVQVYDPLRVSGGRYEMKIIDDNLIDPFLVDNGFWVLTDLNDSNNTWTAEKPINQVNEQLIPELGISVSIEQVLDVGENLVPGEKAPGNGYIGASVEYTTGGDVDWYYGVTDGDANFNGLNPFLGFYFNYIRTGFGEGPDEFKDPEQIYSNVANGSWSPFGLLHMESPDLAMGGIPHLELGWLNNQFSTVLKNQTTLEKLNNVDIVFTSDKSKWSRCVVVETTSDIVKNQIGVQTENNEEQFDLRKSPSVGKDGQEDGDGYGMSWFPGYAIDVETGQRLNIFFGESSIYSDVGAQFFNSPEDWPKNGSDMLYNPTSQAFYNIPNSNPGLDFNPPNVLGLIELMLGGRHWIYVTRMPYDGCETLRSDLDDIAQRKIVALRDVTWASAGIITPGNELKSYSNGVVPSDLEIKLRVNNPYDVMEATGRNSGYPTYEFSLDDLATTTADGAVAEEALDLINVVPNPYYAYSQYETTQFSNIVKITNLPPKCTINIFSLDGKFIRKYTRDESPVGGVGEVGVLERQISTSVDWDLKNNKGIPVSSGVYLIHVDVPGVGERIIKWFGIARQFDPSGL